MDDCHTDDDTTMTTPAMPLSLLPPGREARVTDLRATGRGAMRRLTTMGLNPGVLVSVLNAAGGPVLVRVGDSRIALGRGLAHRVMVTPVSAAN